MSRDDRISAQASAPAVLHAGDRRSDLPYDQYLITDFPPQLGARATVWKLVCRQCGEVFALVKPHKPLVGVRLGDLAPMIAHARKHERGSGR